jgi:hypothetical protein
MKLLKLSACVVLGLAFALPGVPVRADEGMWPFNSVPRAEIKKRYGFDVTDGWLKQVQLSSVRFNNGGSGSFVSPDGLVLTNYHVAIDTLQKLSSPQKDYLKQQFYARTRAEERPAPDLELNVLVSIEDLTPRVNAVVQGKTGDAATTARRALLNEIQEERAKATGLRAEVVTFYGGAQYQLYLYKRYTDVRLVFAPEYAVALFGNDEDNFDYPRYALDMALFRVYEDGKPLRAQNFFKVSQKGAQAEELLFVPGHPGSSSRLSIAPYLEHLRDVTYPLFINRLQNMRGVLQRYGARGEEQARRARGELFEVENGLKAISGQQDALKQKSLMDKKHRDEANLRRALAADPQQQKEYDEAYRSIAQAYQNLSGYERDYYLLDGGWGFDSSLFLAARIIVRIATESAKPNEQRMPAFTDSRRAGLLEYIYSPAPVYDEFEEVKLAGSLSLLRDQMGANSALAQKILNGKTPEARSAELISGTRLRDPEFRKQLVAAGLRGLEQSTDPMIALAYAIEPETRALRKRYETEVTGTERAAYDKLWRVILHARGAAAYPDATFTLRLSYGVMRGYQENGKKIPPFTNLGGLFTHAQQHGGREPYKLPDSWLAKKASLAPQTPLNFISTHDVALGSSGSPVINRRAEVVGLIFDVNHQSLGNNFGYDETQARSICLDIRAILESLDEVYGAKELVAELTKP